MTDFKQKKIRICFLMQYLSIGGIETRLLKLLRNMDRSKFQPVIVCIRDDGLQAEEFKQLDVPIITSNVLLPIRRWIQYFYVLELIAKQRFRRFDVLMSFLPTSQPFENWMARFAVKNRSFAFALVGKLRMGQSDDWNRRTKLAKTIVSVSTGAADAVLFPSTWEGFGNPPVEAAIHRVPCAVGPYPVADELRALGLEWYPSDDPEPLRQAIEQPDTARLDRNRRVAVERLSLDAMRNEIAALLAEPGWLPRPLG